MATAQLHIAKCITPDTLATCLAAVTKRLTRNTHEGERAYFGPEFNHQPWREQLGGKEDGEKKSGEKGKGEYEDMRGTRKKGKEKGKREEEGVKEK